MVARGRPGGERGRVIGFSNGWWRVVAALLGLSGAAEWSVVSSGGVSLGGEKAVQRKRGLYERSKKDQSIRCVVASGQGYAVRSRGYSAMVVGMVWLRVSDAMPPPVQLALAGKIANGRRVFLLCECDGNERLIGELQKSMCAVWYGYNGRQTPWLGRKGLVGVYCSRWGPSWNPPHRLSLAQG